MLVIVAGLFLAGLCGLAAIGQLPVAVAALYIALTVAALVAYRADKAAAQIGAWRTPETTLHLLALAGGWPGGLIAQQVFRHKSRKASFQWVFWVTVVLNCCALAWFCGLFPR